MFGTTDNVKIIILKNTCIEGKFAELGTTVTIAPRNAVTLIASGKAVLETEITQEQQEEIQAEEYRLKSKREIKQGLGVQNIALVAGKQKIQEKKGNQGNRKRLTDDLRNTA